MESVRHLIAMVDLPSADGCRTRYLLASARLPILDQMAREPKIVRSCYFEIPFLPREHPDIQMTGFQETSIISHGSHRRVLRRMRVLECTKPEHLRSLHGAQGTPI